VVSSSIRRDFEHAERLLVVVDRDRHVRRLVRIDPNHHRHQQPPRERVERHDGHS
jgi:hypothetical protein